jgi:tetratricopeptide (TPR) repeat protein
LSVVLRYWLRCAFGLALVSLYGCAVGQTFQGNYYLNMEEYDKGIREFSKRLSENPEDPTANYYLGRLLLAKEQPKEAMPNLQKAMMLKPENAEYHFWTGVAHWGLGESALERARYSKALELSPRYVPAHVYIGHNYQDNGEFSKALDHYASALRLDPENPEALYNSALVLQKLGRGSEEVQGWRSYLNLYADGPLARNAAQYLNARGDFSYRLHGLGNQRFVLKWIEFLPGKDILHPDAESSLMVIGESLKKNQRLKLTIQSFFKDDLALARLRAERVKEFIVSRNHVEPSRILLETYARSEHILAGKTVYALDHSIVFKAE